MDNTVFQNTYWYPETETETVVTEFEYDEEGRVKKETRTVTKVVNKKKDYTYPYQPYWYSSPTCESTETN